MLTFKDAPWVEYLEIDEETGKRRIKEDIPREIREKYELYCLEQEKNKEEMLPK